MNPSVYLKQTVPFTVTLLLRWNLIYNSKPMKTQLRPDLIKWLHSAFFTWGRSGCCQYSGTKNPGWFNDACGHWWWCVLTTYASHMCWPLKAANTVWAAPLSEMQRSQTNCGLSRFIASCCFNEEESQEFTSCCEQLQSRLSRTAQCE